MPFKSEAQRKYLWANEPKIAKRWAHEPGGRKKDLPARVGDQSRKPKGKGGGGQWAGYTASPLLRQKG